MHVGDGIVYVSQLAFKGSMLAAGMKGLEWGDPATGSQHGARLRRPDNVGWLDAEVSA